MGNYAHFSKDPGWWEESIQVLWGSHDICPSLTWFKVGEITRPELLALSHRGMGKHWKALRWYGIPSDSTWENHWGAIAFGLVLVWAYPHQAWLLSLDEAVKKLTLLIDLGYNMGLCLCVAQQGCPTLPLSNEGHLSTMVNGVPCRTMCRHFHQLEVCQLLQYEEPGCVPRRTKQGLGASANLTVRTTPPGNECTWQLCPWTIIPTGGPLQGNTGRPYTWGPNSLQNLNSIFPLPILPWNVPLKQIATSAWTTEVQELLSHAMPDTSSQALGDSTPKREICSPGGSTLCQNGRLLQASSFLSSDFTAGGHACQHCAN